MPSCSRAMACTRNCIACSSRFDRQKRRRRFCQVNDMEQALTRLWYGDSAASLLLQPLALVYRTIVATRRLGYEHGWLRSYQLTRPVVVIGNLTVGGTGKTPLTAWIAQQLRARGRHPGIVSRGYGRAESQPRFVEADDDFRCVG